MYILACFSYTIPFHWFRHASAISLKFKIPSCFSDFVMVPWFFSRFDVLWYHCHHCPDIIVSNLAFYFLTHILLSAHTHTHTHTCTHTYTHVHTHTQTQTRIRKHMYITTYKHAHTYIHTHIQSHTHSHYAHSLTLSIHAHTHTHIQSIVDFCEYNLYHYMHNYYISSYTNWAIVQSLDSCF